MCEVCGCGNPYRPGAKARARPQPDTGTLDFGSGAAGVTLPGMTQVRVQEIQEDILGRNDAIALRNRRRFESAGTLALNLVSSPGSGKTTLLVESLKRLTGHCGLAVIEGDQQTNFDAERIRATGVAALQVNTGRGCHLDAAMIERALGVLPPPTHGILFIENVGNLVCPAGFDLGEAHKVVVLSVTEGEDKPLKYPDMFAAADLMLLTKIDLLPHLRFDVARCCDYARQINPALEIFLVSAESGQGMEAWLDWLRLRQQPRAESVV